MCRMGMGGCIDEGRMGVGPPVGNFGRFLQGGRVCGNGTRIIGLDVVIGKSLTRHLAL
jgi:hypothetical protein